MRRNAFAAAFASLIAAFAPAHAAPAAGPAPADFRPVDAANTVVIDTNQGRVVVELYPLIAPQSVARIETLARQHFYDGQTFFRVIDGFMDQTGDPTNTGQGASTLPNLPAEFDFRYTPGRDVSEVSAIPEGMVGFVGALPVVGQPDAMADLTADGKVRAFALFCPGVIGMARAEAPDSGNSQFFLMRAENLGLNEKYTAFGRVIAGEDVVRKIKTGDPVADPRDVMATVRVLADMPPDSRPSLEILDTSSAYFRGVAAATRAAKKEAFDPCALDIPVRPGGGAAG
jgi:peptidylprolyl isomerase